MKYVKSGLSLILAVLLMFGTLGVISYAADGETDEVPISSEVTVKLVNGEKEVTVGYKEAKSFEFKAENLPDGAEVHVFLNGEDLRADTYLSVPDPTENYTVQAKVIDKDGKVIASSDLIKVTVKNGILDQIMDFFSSGFGTIGDAIADIFGAIFMRIWIFVHDIIPE